MVRDQPTRGAEGSAMSEAINQPLIIRADANAHIGTGHLMRCLALAQGWQTQGGQAIFVTACESDSLLRRLSDEGFQVVTLERTHPDPADWEITSEALSAHPGAWVALDGYHFDPAYQRWIREAGHPLLVIDDMAHLDHYYADIVLNQNIHAEKLDYSCESHTRLLLGTRYALLRSEFLAWRGWQREIPEVARKVLVTLGGGDPDNQTLKIIRALQQVEVEGLDVVVVVGASNPHFDELQSAARNSQCVIRLVRNATNMPELMAWADVAVSAGGSTCWELAFMGLPTLILIVADNQRPIAEQLDIMGMAVNLGWYEGLSSTEVVEAITHSLMTPKMRVEMARRGQELVDGEGVARVLMCLRDKELRLRHVREEDCKMLWEWVNDPEVRGAAFSSDAAIPWEDHVQWFMRKLHDANCFLFIALDNQDTPVGQVRFDVKNDDETEIGVSIDRSRREAGYGSLLINMAVEEIFRVTPVRAVHAFIKPYNEGSIRAFEKAKFKRLGMETVRGNTATHYVRVKSNE